MGWQDQINLEKLSPRDFSTNLEGLSARADAELSANLQRDTIFFKEFHKEEEEKNVAAPQNDSQKISTARKPWSKLSPIIVMLGIAVGYLLGLSFALAMLRDLYWVTSVP